MSESEKPRRKYPEVIFIKDTDFKGADGTYSRPMYVTVNPWFEKFATWETAYYHIDYLSDLEKENERLKKDNAILLEAVELIEGQNEPFDITTGGVMKSVAFLALEKIKEVE